MQKSSYTDEKLGRTLRDDVFHGNILQSLRLDYREVKEFYLDDEKKQRLATMNWLKRGIYMTGWLIKILLLRLSPVRRLLLVIGMLLILFSGSIQWRSGSFQASPETYIFGGALIVFVLMLELKDKLLARSELEAGRSVQYALMPPQKPHIPGWSVWLYSQPANEVGGDLVDYVKIDEERHGIAIGDIAGKGLRAALLMAKLQATVRALVDGYGSLSKFLKRVNNIFYRDGVRGIFASLLFVELSAATNSVRFVNAGHIPPIRLNRQNLESLGKSVPALGLLEDAEYEETSIELEQGELLIAYSDGVTEARSEDGKFFDEERLFNILKRSVDLPPEKIGERVLTEINNFRGDARVYDDISMVIIKRT